MTPDPRELKRLGKELKKLNTGSIEDMRKALVLLNGEAAIDPATLPTRQQRRKAERDRQKKGAGR
jgi:hypothetical protein